MPKQSNRTTPRASDSNTTKAHILSSLAYLTSICESDDCQAILQVSLDICTICSRHEEDGEGSIRAMPSPRSQEGLVAALGFLRCEAGRNKMGDFETIIEAAGTLISYFLIYEQKQTYLLRH